MPGEIGSATLGDDLVIGGTGSGALPGTFTSGSAVPTPTQGVASRYDPDQIDAKAS